MRMLLYAVIAIAIVYIGLIVVLYLMQNRLLYYPTRTIVATPADVRLEYEKVRLTASDGVTIAGWFVESESSHPTIIFLHGNGGNLSHTVETIGLLQRIGLNVLAIDYRGYGESDGEASEEGTYRDAEAAWRYLTEDQGIDRSRIVVMGRSLGGGIASWLAARHEPAALILESTFTSVPAMAAMLYPWVPARLLARNVYDNLGRIGRIECPVLIVHGSPDEMVPFAHGEELFANANDPKEFLRIEGGHNDGFILSGDRYVEGLERFLRRHGLLPESPER